MLTRQVRQAISEDCLFDVFADWCRNGTGQRSHSLKVLTAFVSGTGVSAIAPLLDVFLADGNSVEIIFGVDRNGTDREAIRQLFALKRAYIGQLDVRVFQAPSANSIFHPKLYIYDHGQKIDFVIGSSNLTSGGLASNFESLLLYEKVPRRSRIGRSALSIWETFSQPRAPLSATFLRELTRTAVKKLLTTLPVRTAVEPRNVNRKIRQLWKPLSRVRLPRSGQIQLRRKDHGVKARQYLVMDLLDETRKTQVQIPLHVVEHFFGIERDKPASISVSVLTSAGTTQPIRRPIVISGLGYGRLMRRLEMPQIKTMKRPLAVVFVKLPGRAQYAYSLLERKSTQFSTADKLLDRYGRQTGFQRRYIIGTRRDRLWTRVSRLFPEPL
jgi:hypothetical protein